MILLNPVSPPFASAYSVRILGSSVAAALLSAAFCQSGWAQQPPNTQLPTVVVTPPAAAPKKATPKKAQAKSAPGSPIVAIPPSTPAPTAFGTRTLDTSSKGYAVPDQTTATKTNVPLIATPFSLQTVPSDLIRDQAATRIEDALKNVPGVQIAREGIYDGVTLRGFAQGLDRWIYRDGAPFLNATFNFANIDRVEVLKGTAGGIYGRIDPGGMVNIVTKKPLATPYYAIEQEFRSFGGTRTTADATGPLTKDGSIRYRTIASFDSGGAFRDFVDSRNVLFSPSVSWHLTPSTELFVNYEYRKNERTFDLGIPVINNQIVDVPRSRFFGLKDQPLSKTESHIVDTQLTQKLGEGWVAKLKGTYSTLHQLSYDSEVASPGAPGFVNIYYSKLDGDYKSYFAEASLVGTTKLSEAVSNRLFLSAEYYRTEGDPGLNGTSNPAIVRPLNITNPVYQSWQEVKNLPLTFGLPSFTQWHAVTAQEQITLFNKLDLFAGGRWDWAASGSGFCPLSGGATRCAPSTSLDGRDDAIFKPRAGVNFRVLPNVAIFGSYSESFGPVVGFGRLADGSVPKPTEATQYEVGLRMESPGGGLRTTLAVYDLTRTNINTPIPGQPFVVSQTGEARSRGMEFDVAGRLTDWLQITGSYAYTDVRITKDIDDAGGIGNQGNMLANVPRHQAGIWLHLLTHHSQRS